MFCPSNCDYLSALKVEGRDHSLGLQLGEVQLSEPFLSNSLRRRHLAGGFALTCLTFCVRGARFQKEVVSRARKLDIVVHSCQGIERPPMEVSLVLHTNGAGADANVC